MKSITSKGLLIANLSFEADTKQEALDAIEADNTPYLGKIIEISDTGEYILVKPDGAVVEDLRVAVLNVLIGLL